MASTQFITFDSWDAAPSAFHKPHGKVGSIITNYQFLMDTFGKPIEFDANSGDGKVDVEWLIQFDDGTIARLHNWKDGPNYCGPDGTPVEDIMSWSVGGFSHEAVHQVSNALDAMTEHLLSK